MKRLISLLIAIILIFSAFPLSAFASFNSLLETESDIVLLVNTDSETVIYDKNTDKRTAPSDLAKIITGILVIEKCSDLNTPITVKRECIDGLYNLGGTTVGILSGEVLSVSDLLHCMLIHSADDAANLLADYVGGGIQQFVAMMNEFVKGLGCENTYFINANGMPGDGSAYTTAADMYKIAKYAMANQTFSDICNKRAYQVQPTAKYPQIRYLNNTNKMLIPAFGDYYSRDVSGVKSAAYKAGDTERCSAITTASKNGYNYMLIIMDAPVRDVDSDGKPENVSFTESRKIYKWAFDNIILTKVTATTDVVTVVDIKYNWNVDHIRLVPAEEISALVPIGTETASLVIKPIENETPKEVKAPINQGDVLGKAEILYGESVVATVDLVAAEGVKRNTLLWILSMLKTIFTSLPFKILFGLAVALLIIYIALIIRKNRIKAKRRKIKMIKG